jgi:hypothetical protein
MRFLIFALLLLSILCKASDDDLPQREDLVCKDKECPFGKECFHGSDGKVSLYSSN